jgi:predicted membrane metal-binding protein
MAIYEDGSIVRVTMDEKTPLKPRYRVRRNEYHFNLRRYFLSQFFFFIRAYFGEDC